MIMIAFRSALVDEDDEALDSEEERPTFRHAPRVKKVLLRWWKSCLAEFDLDGNGTIEQVEYLGLYKRLVFGTAAMQGTTVAVDEDIHAFLERDWAHDSGGMDNIDQVRFCDSIYELAQAWCTTGDTASAYARFLSDLHAIVFENHVPTSPVAQPSRAKQPRRRGKSSTTKSKKPAETTRLARTHTEGVGALSSGPQPPKETPLPMKDTRVEQKRPTVPAISTSTAIKGEGGVGFSIVPPTVKIVEKKLELKKEPQLFHPTSTRVNSTVGTTPVEQALRAPPEEAKKDLVNRLNRLRLRMEPVALQAQIAYLRYSKTQEDRAQVDKVQSLVGLVCNEVSTSFNFLSDRITTIV